MGNVAETEQYDPLGGGTGSALTRYDYTGRERDSATGLIFSRARWYDSSQGRFITQDPIGMAGGLNRYSYAGGNPIGFVDPSGQSWKTFRQGLVDGGITGLLAALGYAALLTVLTTVTAGTAAAVIPEVIAALAGPAAAAAIGGQIVDLLSGYFSGRLCADDLHYKVGFLIGSVVGAIAGGGIFKGLVGEPTPGVSGGDSPAPKVNEGGIPGGRGSPEPALGGGCFVAGTMVKTPDGEKPIEQIKLGDKVLAANPETGEPEARTVTHTFVLNAPALLDITAGGTTFTCTPEHMFQTEDGEWKRADELKVGDRLVTVSGTSARIESIKRREGRFTVYNLGVGQLHTYYVSGLGVLAHNQNCVMGSGPPVQAPPQSDVQAVIDAGSANPNDVGVGILDTQTGQIHLSPASELAEGDHASLAEEALGITDIDQAPHLRGFVVGQDAGGWRFVNMSGLNPSDGQMEPALFEKVVEILGPMFHTP